MQAHAALCSRSHGCLASCSACHVSFEHKASDRAEGPTAALAPRPAYRSAQRGGRARPAASSSPVSAGLRALLGERSARWCARGIGRDDERRGIRRGRGPDDHQDRGGRGASRQRAVRAGKSEEPGARRRHPAISRGGRAAQARTLSLTPRRLCARRWGSGRRRFSKTSSSVSRRCKSPSSTSPRASSCKRRGPVSGRALAWIDAALQRCCALPARGIVYCKHAQMFWIRFLIDRRSRSSTQRRDVHGGVVLVGQPDGRV